MAIISFYSLKIIFGHFTRCNWTCLLSMVFVFFFGGILHVHVVWYKNGLFGATTHKYIDFTALNAGIRWERKSQIGTNQKKTLPSCPRVHRTTFVPNWSSRSWCWKKIWIGVFYFKKGSWWGPLNTSTCVVYVLEIAL